MTWSRRSRSPHSSRRHWVPALSLAAAGALAAALVVPLDRAAGEDLGGLELLSESEALAIAKESGQETVADALTTSNLLVTALPSGGFRADTSLYPVRVRDENGAWQPVDNTLVQRPDGSVGPVRAAVPVSFSGGGDAPLVQITDGERSMALSWPHGDLPEPRLTGSAAEYSEVLPGVDLVARATPTGHATYVVVRSAQAAAHPAVQDLAFDVDAVGVQVHESPQGGLSAVAGTEEVFAAAAPIAWDSEGATDAVEPAFTAEEAAVDAPLSPPLRAETEPMPMQASSSEISLDASAVLEDPDTVWPAVIDPSVTRGDFKWAMVWSNGTEFYKDGSEHARVGYDGWSGQAKKSRVFYEMDVPLSVLAGSWIASASFAHKQIHSPNQDCYRASYGSPVRVYETTAFGSSISWSNQPEVKEFQDGDTRVWGHEDYCSSGRQEWDVIEAVKDSVADGDGSMYLMIRSDDEGDKYGWRKYENTSTYPELSVTYYPYPPSPTDLDVSPVRYTAAHGYWSSTARPVLSARVSDPSGGWAYGLFRIYSGSTMIWQGVGSGGSAAGHTSTITVPTGVLANGGSYWLRAYSSADANATYVSSGYRSMGFGVDTSPPASPSIKLNEDCTVGGTCHFTVGAAADVVDYRYGMNTDALPFLVTKTAAASQSVSMSAGIFGPSWVTAKVSDRAGWTSAARALNFKVRSTSMSHKWALDGTGTDTGAPGGTTLAFPAGTSFGDGASAPGGPNLGYDSADKALAGGSGRYASAGAAGSGLVNFATDDDFSVAAWVKLPTTPTDGVALSQAGSSNTAFALGYWGGNWTLWLRGSEGAAPVSISAPATGSAGKWVHLAAVYNNETAEVDVDPKVGLMPRRATIYVNGRPAASKDTGIPEVFRASGPLLLGRNTAAGAAHAYWTGSLDDVRTFPGVIDDSQVMRIAAERRPTG